MDADLWRLDATALATLIRTGKVSAREAVAAHLERLDAVNPRINAVVRVLSDEALAEAEAADERQRAGQPLGPLHGLPITTKITTDQAGCPTDNGVAKFKDLIASQDSPQIGSLRRAGAIVIGRTNSPAFGMRGTTENALHGLTLNPWDRDVTCGGSSGGAGASVAAGIGVIAHGNDLGSSIRWPAYCNGVVGLRPSPGRVASFNPTATAPSRMSVQLMAVNGPLTRSVRDARLALSVMAARDARDPRWVPAPLIGAPPDQPRRAALVTDPEGIAIQPVVAEAVRTAGRYLAAAGYQIEEEMPPQLKRAVDLWHAICLTDLNEWMRPALKEDGAGDPGMEQFFNAWWEIKGGTKPTDYVLALIERDALQRQWQLFMETYPVIIMPSCPEVAVPTNVDVQGLEGAARMLESQQLQLVLPVLGLPGLAVPLPPQDELPMGVQVVSRRYREDLCLDAGEIIEAHAGTCTPIDPRF